MTEVLHTIKSFSNANNHELFSCAPPPPLSEILDPRVMSVHEHTFVYVQYLSSVSGNKAV